MKKLVVLLMMIVLTGCFIACGKEEEVVTDNGQTDEVVTDNENTEDGSEEDKSSSKDEEKEENVDVDTYYNGSVFYDYPITHSIREEGGIAFIVSDEHDIMVGLYRDVIDKKENDSLENIVDFANEDGFMKKVARAGSGGSTFYLEEDIVVTSSEIVTMAGRDSMKFEGTAPNKDTDGPTWDCYVYGYTFLFDNISYAVIGVVAPQEQDEEMIEQMKQQVDDMAASLRTER